METQVLPSAELLPLVSLLKWWRNPLASLKALELRHRNIDIFLYIFSDSRKYANEQDLQPPERWKQRDLVVNFFSLGVRLVCGGQYRMLSWSTLWSRTMHRTSDPCGNQMSTLATAMDARSISHLR